MDNKGQWSGETIISLKKIWQNIKQFWWIFIICILGYSLLLVRDIRNTYQADVNLAARDTYQSSTLLYFEHQDNEQGLAFVVLCESELVIDQVNARLEENGFEKYGNGDTFDVNWIGNSFGLTFVGEGEERMLCIAEAFADAILSSAYAVTGKMGSIMNQASVVPCLVKSSGAVVVCSDPSQRIATFSLKEFFSWRRIMVLGAALFMGVAFIFVVILLDKRVRTREEMERVLTVPCFGTIQRKKEDTKKMTMDLLGLVCKQRKIESLAMVTVGKFSGLEELGKMLPENIHVNYGMEANKDFTGIFSCDNKDGIILVIQVNKDTVDQVCLAVKNMELCDQNLIGYILAE